MNGNGNERGHGSPDGRRRRDYRELLKGGGAQIVGVAVGTLLFIFLAGGLLIWYYLSTRHQP